MVGSRWYKFDFHNHTPASHDYKIPDISPREWLLAYMKQHVDCVVISDHNSGAWVDVLKGELENMSRDASTGDLPEFRPLTLFPGIELTATGNVHILAVLHTHSTSADVERLLAQCNNNSPIPSVNATMFDRYLPFSCPLNTFVTDAVRFSPFHHH